MSIGYFPVLYEDELIYSVLARWYAHSGMLCYRNAVEKLFVQRNQNPDIEFINTLKEEVIRLLCRDMSMQELIIKHTMFPQYARFIDKERRDKALEALCNMNNEFRNHLVMRKNREGEERKLRYCPLCSKQDREEKGETYWRRSHQLIDVDICPVHKCKLLSSEVVIKMKTTPCFKVAELEIPKESAIIKSESPLEVLISEYVYKVFQLGAGYENSVPVGAFLHSKLVGTKYASVRGEQRNISLLYKDLTSYYVELSGKGIMQLSQLQKVFTGYRFNLYEVCQIAMFLSVEPEELLGRTIPKEKGQDTFDRKVLEMHESGIGYNRIARQLGVSSITVRKAGNYQPRKEKQYKEKCGAKQKDWSKIDKETLVTVRALLAELNQNDTERPERITEGKICRLLGCPNRRLDYLPLCKQEVMKYAETQEEYWSREVIWSLRKLRREGEPLNWRHIRNLTNMRKRNLEACLPELEKRVEKEEFELLRAMVCCTTFYCDL